jgi:predicted DNA-binding protein
MSNQMIVRIQPELKAKVNTLAKAEGKSVSEVVRELLDGYVKNRDISSYIDDLWDRVGSSLKSRGVRRSDIQRAIKDARISR